MFLIKCNSSTYVSNTEIAKVVEDDSRIYLYLKHDKPICLVNVPKHMGEEFKTYMLQNIANAIAEMSAKECVRSLMMTPKFYGSFSWMTHGKQHLEAKDMVLDLEELIDIAKTGFETRKQQEMDNAVWLPI